ncbi:MAG TPA: HD domain-containing phosphohydrolase [Symbiobacteriaceae bacterium]|nr:HD domain-containing phosphohydrolase [Symbiobacteriaceae bacterium]
MPLAGEVKERHDKGSTLLGRGLLVAARDEFTRLLALVEPSQDSAMIIPALNALTKVAVSRGDQEAALAYLQKGLTLVEAPGASPSDKLRIYLNLIIVYTELGKLEEARQFLDKVEAKDLDREPRLGILYWLNKSVLHWRRQEWVPMRQAADKAYHGSVAAGNVSHSVRALTNRGIAHLELGAYRLAERDLMSTLRMEDQLDASELAYSYAELGRLHFQLGDYSASLDAGRRALGALLTDVAFLDKEEVARVSRLFGSIFSSLGQRNLALKYLNRSAAYFSQMGLRAEWQRSTEAIGQVLSGPVRPARSQLLSEVHQLDFLTAVLDLTDDLESVDPYLRGHSERVALLAKLLGEESGLSAEALTTLSYAARLHDVGMVAIDSELLHRDGPLTDSERRRVALHTEIGEEMLRPYGLPAEGLKAIRHHHEHFDGSGTPEGLQGEAIPLLARLVTVTDVYDALTSERVYRGAMNHAGAVQELRNMAGRELDPVLVERFISLHNI